MKKIIPLLAIVFLLLSIPVTADQPSTEQNQISQIEKVRKSTVCIMFGVGGFGTGFYVAENYILTNAHVVGDYKTVHVTTDRGGSYEQVVAVDTSRDLALIKTEQSRPPLKLAKSVAVGSDTFISGWPGGSDLITVPGIISQVRDDSMRGVIATASIQVGMSGSALTNSSGEVVGILTGWYKKNTDFLVAVHNDDIKEFLKRNGVSL